MRGVEIARKPVPILDQVLRILDHFLRVVLTVGFGMILVVTLVQIAGRYGSFPTMAGADEIARYLMVGTTFLALPVLINSKLQIAVGALADFLPEGMTQVWLHRTIFIIEGLFYLAFSNFTFLTLESYQRTGQSSVELSIPLTWPFATMVLGAGLGGIFSICLLIRTFIRPGDYADKTTTGFPGSQGVER
ncbi:TRAP transporter small permease [Nesterenkonia ebinurensis]|uniref:TRAP transporter small permease n=1 Tax=Nesterenkonia ebinurensis TaxID=2608252 RepID=UPI00123D58FA|nr:TRAP transporter small permease subunit [Nesterenkonia ebinurensis]